MSGYVSCKCNTCFEIAIEDKDGEGAYCSECEEAGCPDYDGLDCQCQFEEMLDNNHA